MPTAKEKIHSLDSLKVGDLICFEGKNGTVVEIVVKKRPDEISTFVLKSTIIGTSAEVGKIDKIYESFLKDIRVLK